MPTLFRLLTVLALIVLAAYGGLYALATFVEPFEAEMSVRVPLEGLEQPPR